ncbi:MAG: hypothetical protein LBT26_07385 [Clostridiales Family XIII bacterium]|jgi:hypothetical protein|nr:hypothetical protein [Clostridiales Family XIII bacterium]
MNESTNKTSASASGIGVTTLFVVLLILCLTVFAVLTFASSQADLRLSRKNADMVTAYYDADNAGARISAEVAGFWPKGTQRPGADVCALLENKISAGTGGEDISYAAVGNSGAGLTVSYGIVVDTLLTLEIELSLPESGVCEVLSWRVVAEEPDFFEEPMPVWQG